MAPIVRRHRLLWSVNEHPIVNIGVRQVCRRDALKWYSPSQIAKTVSYNQEESVRVISDKYFSKHVYRKEFERLRLRSWKQFHLCQIISNISSLTSTFHTRSYRCVTIYCQWWPVCASQVLVQYTYTSVPCRFVIMAHVHNPAFQIVWYENLCIFINRVCKYALVVI